MGIEGDLSAHGLTERDISLTFVKGMAVLKAFDDNHTRLTLTDIAKITGLDRASVRRLVLTLVALGYVRKDGRHFALTPRVLILAGSFLRGNRFGSHIQPLLNRYARAFGCAISLAIADEDAAVYVAQSSSQEEAVTFGFTVGSRLPLLHTAIGRMMLAYGEASWREACIRGLGFEQYTPDTEMDRAEIARRVESCRTQGYAIANGEFDAGVTGFAVPVGRPGDLRAVVGMSQPNFELRDEEMHLRRISELQQVAQELGRSGLFEAG